MKRGFDIVASFFGLLILSLLFLFLAIAIRRDSPGSVFYLGKRVGRRGKEFKIIKFRTMYESSESNNGPHLTAHNDKRITPFGRWLRDTKLNELPQLWNVLVGDMSLVGPRPEDPKIVAGWSEAVKKELLSVRPGVTSPASILYRDVEHLLNSSSIMDDYLSRILPEKLRLDQLYVQQNSLITDLDVIFTTLIMLLPRLRRTNVSEKVLFSGPLFNLSRRFLSWFVIDSLVAFLAIGLAGSIWRLEVPLDLGVGRAILIALAFALILGIINSLFGLKRITWRYANPTFVLDLGFSTFIAVLVLVLLDVYALPKRLVPMGLLWDAGLLAFLGFVLVRYRERLLTGLAYRWLAFRGTRRAIGERVLIVGAGECGELAIWLLNKSKLISAFSIQGFVDDNYHKHDYSINGYQVLGTTRDIPKITAKKNIGVIMFAISKCKPVDRDRILAICRKTSARVVVIPDLMDVLEQSLMQKKRVVHAK